MVTFFKNGSLRVFTDAFTKTNSKPSGDNAAIVNAYHVTSYSVTVKPVYSRHLGTQQNCPDYRGVLISEVHLYTFIL